MGIEDTQDGCFVAVGSEALHFYPHTHAWTALVSSWCGSWVPPERGIKITPSFLPQQSDFVASAMLSLLLRFTLGDVGGSATA